jgi:hemoglobin
MRNALLVIVFLSACAGSNQGGKPAAGKPLYDRLGGTPAITAVVGNFVTRVGNDQRINARFANTDLAHLKQMLVEQICQASGGPCKYTGKDMKAAHAGQKVTDEEFNALVEDLQGALNELKVGAPEQKDLLGALGPMRPDIVGQ